MRECGQRGPGGPGGRPDYAEPAAHAVLILLTVACALLDRQIVAQDAAFEKEGGFTERLYRVRSQSRSTLSTPVQSTLTPGMQRR